MKTIGIIGCGNIGRSHARILSGLDDVVLAFCDRNLDRAQAFGAEFGSTKVFQSLSDMLTIESLDALYVLTRVESHAVLAEMALDAGVHTYLEKPITDTEEEFQTLRAKAQANHVVLYPGLSALGFQEIQKLRPERIRKVGAARHSALRLQLDDPGWLDPIRGERPLGVLDERRHPPKPRRSPDEYLDAPPGGCRNGHIDPSSPTAAPQRRSRSAVHRSRVR